MASPSQPSINADVDMPSAGGAGPAVDGHKASMRRLSSKAPPPASYMARVEWTDEETKERGKLLSKLSRTLPEAPRAARSSWLIFCSEYCVKKGGASGEIFGEAGKAWATLEAAEKGVYDAQATAEKEKNKAEMDEFKKSDSYKGLTQEVDKFLLVNRVRGKGKKAELSWKEFKALRAKKQPKLDGAKGKAESRAEANCINRIALKLAAAARKTSPGSALPIPPKSAYALYSSEIMSKDMKETTEKKTASYLKDLLKKVAEGWAGLSDDQKSGYKETAAKDSERYAAEIKTFKDSDAYCNFVQKASEVYKESQADQKPGEAPKSIAQIIKEAETKAREKAKLEKKRTVLQMKLVSCLKGGEGGPPKPPVQAFLLFCNEKRADAIKELATGAAGADSAKKESAPKEKEGDEEMEDPEEPEEPEDEEDEDEEGGKKKGKGGKGGKGGGMAANAAIIKKLGAMWATASAEEKAKFEERVAKEKEAYAAEMKAWYDSEGFKAFTMEVDEWEAEIKDKGGFPKAPLKSFRAWRRKKLQGKRQQQKLADRERAKAEKMAAKMKAKGEKLKPKKGKAGAEAPEEPVVLPPLLQKDPFWDTCLDSPEAILASADVLLGDRVALAAAKHGGAKGLAALKWLQTKPHQASSFFRTACADCQETALHYAFQHEDLEMIQILQKEASRHNGRDTWVSGTVKDGIMTFELVTGAQLWFWPPRQNQIGYRAGPSDQDPFVQGSDNKTRFIVPGDAVWVRELRGSWIRTDIGWVPLVVGSEKSFVREDPSLWRVRPNLPNPELQPVSTGFARGRAFRAKKLRKVKLSRGGAEGNQAFVKDMETEDNYVQPRMRLDIAMQWSIRRGMGFKTLAACCEIFQQNQPSDFLGAAVQCGRWQLAGDLVTHMGVGDLYGLNQQHRTALLPVPTEAELAECVKRKASITKKAVANFEIMPIHCACINPTYGKTILEMMLTQLGPAAEDMCKDSEQRTLVHYAAVCESEEPLEVLLTQGFSPHRIDSNSMTPLMYACMANRPKNVARLLAAKADPLVRSSERTSFHLSVQQGSAEALKALVSHMATLAAEMPPPVKGKKGGKKPKPSWQLATSSSQRTALHDACAVGRLDMAVMLLEEAPGALHKCDKQGRSPLTFAVMNGHALLASHLIHRRALVDQNDSSGNSPLHYAMAYGWQDIAKLLVDCGHDPNVQNKWRNSPVDVSLLKGHAALASWYVAECPIQPDSFDEKGRTLLTRACSNLGDKIWRNVLTALVSKRGADVNLPDGQGDLPICLAAHACSAQSAKNNPELNSALKLLCSAKADVGRRAEKGQFQNQSAISIALKGSNSDLLRMMLESGAGLAAHGRGETLLHAMPERLIRRGYRNAEGDQTAEQIFQTIRSCVPKESLRAMAQTMDANGLAPVHSVMLNFKQAIKILRADRQNKEAEMKSLQKQRDEAMRKQQTTVVSQMRPTMESKSPALQQALQTEEAARKDFQKCLLWLCEEAGADPMLPIGPLEKPWKDPKKPEDAQAKPPSVNAEYPVEPAPKIEEVVERSVLAFDQSTYFKYQPDLGMTTPLMLLVKTGDSEAIAWFLDELAKRNLVEKALEASTLFGTTPLVIAIQMEVHLDEGLLGRLASPKAASIRRYDGKTALHLATTGGAHGWTKNVQRQENFKDCRAVAFEVTLKAAKMAGCVDATDAKGWTALACALSTQGPRMPKMLEPWKGGIFSSQATDFSQKDASMASAENAMYKAFGKIEEQLKNAKGFTAGTGAPVTATSVQRRVVSVAGMGSHVKWRFDDLGAIINGLKHPAAEAAGLKVGMRLVSIAGNSVAGMQKDQILTAWKNFSGNTGTLEFEDMDAAPTQEPTQAVGAKQPAFGNAGGFGAGNAFGGPGFGAPTPAFGAPAPAFGAAFGAAPGGGPAFAFGGGNGFGGAPALKAARFGGLAARAAPKFGFGAPASQLGTVPADPAPEPVEAESAPVPAMVGSADACYHSLDASAVYASFQCHITQGRWYFELQHVHIEKGKIGVALCGHNLVSSQEPQVIWISDSRPWKNDSTIGVALDCDAATAQLVMNQVWGEPTAIPRVDPSSGKTLMPVLCGEGACTICFKKTQQASDHKSLPFQQISEVMAPALGASRLVHALLQAGAKPSSSNRNGENGEVILPLHLATKSDDAQSVRLLSRSGADLNVTDPTSGRTCVHIATSKGCLGAAIALLTARADVNFPDPLEGQGHLGAALYGQRRGPRLALHTAVEHGSDSMVGQLVQFGANVGVSIETRHVSSKKMWLPLPPADVDATGKVNDEFKKNGRKVGIAAPLALELLRALKIKEEDLEVTLTAVTARAKKVAGLDADSGAASAGIVPMFCGTVESLPAEVDQSLFSIGGGDFTALLQQSDKKLQMLVSRQKLMYYQDVESIKITYAQPLQKAAARNATAMVKVLLNASADTTVVDTLDGRQAIHHAVNHLNERMVRLLLNKTTPLDTPDATTNKATAIFYAVKAATENKPYGAGILKDLLEAKATIDKACCQGGHTVLHVAAGCRHLQVLQQLLDLRASPTSVDPAKRTPLHWAVNSASASEPSFDAERLLLNARADVNALDVQHRMPLHYAFVKKEKQLDTSAADPVETVTSLCAVEGVQVDVPDEFGATPLLCAARRGATISSLYLSKRGANLKTRDNAGNDALGIALAGGHDQYAITLLSQGAGDVEAPMRHLRRVADEGAAGDRKRQRVTPGPPLSLFRESTSRHWLGLSYLLLDHGYPFHGAIQDALELGEFRLVLTLLSKINPSENHVLQRLDTKQRNLLHALAGFGKTLAPEATAIADELFRRGLQPLALDANQRLPLHDAAMNAHRELSRWLIRQDPSKGSCAAKDAEDQLPVHAVCTRQWLQQHSEADHLAFLDMILPLYPSAAQMSFDYAAGAKVELEQCKAADRDVRELGPDPKLNVPLVNVARTAFKKSVARLLEARSDPNMKDGRNATSLCNALQSSCATTLEVVKLLLFHAADANGRDGGGKTPLHYAVVSKYHPTELIMELARAGARFTEAPSAKHEGSLVLDALNFSAPADVLTKLLKLGANPSQGTDAKGRAPLLLAVDQRNQLAISSLLAHKANATVLDAAGRSALSAAMTMAAWKTAEALLKAGADPQKGRDKDGQKPLLTATIAGNAALVRHLLKAKAETSAGEDKLGRSPLSVAILANRKDVVDELLNAHADPSHKDKKMRNALHHCIQPKPHLSYECTRLLAAMLRTPQGLEAATVKDDEGLTPLCLAAKQGSGRMVAVLAAAGLQVQMDVHQLLAPSCDKPDLDADARKELELVEATVKKTPIPVHKAYGMTGANKVFEDDAGEYDALLFKVDLKRDEMRFYHLQLVYETNKDLYVLFTRWGEIGETGMFQRTPAANKEEGMKDFCKVFKEKTGNVWDATGATFEKKPNKYQLLKRRRATARSEEIVQPFCLGTNAKSKLPHMVWRTIDSICDPTNILQAVRSMGIKTQSMPFGSLSRATLDEAKSLLGDIKVAIEELKAQKAGRSMKTGFAKAEEVLEASKKRNEIREKILELSSRYYELVPRGAGTTEVARPIENDANLAKEFEQLLNLTEASVGIRTALAAQHQRKMENPLDYCVRCMGVAFEQVNQESSEFKALMDYMCQTSCGSPPRVAKPGDIPEQFGQKRRNAFLGHRSHDTVTAIYRISREGEAERFKDLGNRRLLWHGSRRSNFISILSQGLRVAPPEAPVQGYMFGKGIYFADVYAKSRAYCASGNGEATYMLLCDVSLGNSYPSHQAHYMEEPQAGTNSTWGVGQSHPSWENACYEPGGAQVPGRMKDGRGGGLGHSEFIVYDPAQVRMRYLVELNNFESPSEKHAREVAEAAARGEAHPAKKLRTPEPEEEDEDEDVNSDDDDGSDAS